MKATDTPKGADHRTSDVAKDCPGHYEIRVRGHLDARWVAWLEGLSLRNENDGTTTIEGAVADQAALHGLLQRLRDLGVPLVSVTPAHPEPP